MFFCGGGGGGGGAAHIDSFNSAVSVPVTTVVCGVWRPASLRPVACHSIGRKPLTTSRCGCSDSYSCLSFYLSLFLLCARATSGCAKYEVVCRFYCFCARKKKRATLKREAMPRVPATLDHLCALVCVPPDLGRACTKPWLAADRCRSSAGWCYKSAFTSDTCAIYKMLTKPLALQA